MARLRLIMIFTPEGTTRWINPEQIVEFGQADDSPQMVLRMSDGRVIETATDMGVICQKAGGDYVP